MNKMKAYKGDNEPSKLEEPELTGLYSYADYLKWTFDGMVELINGKVFKMAPAPNSKHQFLSGNLFGIIWNYLKGKPCQVVSAPFDVRLSKFKDDKLVDSVVQPDICIICDASKIDEKGCNGAPDMIIEILSVATAEKDLNLKFKLYEENAVNEYWIIEPLDQTVRVYDLKNGKFALRGIYQRYNAVRLNAISLDISLDEVFF
jgi:Uma2 family endonuclease